MIPHHEWTVTRGNVWDYWVCTTCPNHHMKIRKVLTVKTPDDHKVSTCPNCGNYCGGGCRPGR